MIVFAQRDSVLDRCGAWFGPMTIASGRCKMEGLQSQREWFTFAICTIGHCGLEGLKGIYTTLQEICMVNGLKVIPPSLGQDAHGTKPN